MLVRLSINLKVIHVVYFCLPLTSIALIMQIRWCFLFSAYEYVDQAWANQSLNILGPNLQLKLSDIKNDKKANGLFQLVLMLLLINTLLMYSSYSRARIQNSK